jgi:DNA mismatch repair protein MutL
MSAPVSNSSTPASSPTPVAAPAPVNRIRLLSEQVANQIAAGEVVERPASVVKELVENALDAEAGRITVEIQAGGRSLIRVTDDGTGMTRDDALLCLERHATSKIRRAEDLSAILTMGFRGEALPSIASVGRMVLTTRERTSVAPSATQVIIHGGKILEVREAGAPAGTCIELRQLFFNLPARRRFLRSEETEFAHIHHYLTLAALAHPGVGFTFVKDGRTLWQLPAVPRATEVAHRLEALRQRVRGLLGNEEKLLAVDFQARLPARGADPLMVDANGVEVETEELAEPSPQFRLWGLIGQPGVARSTREEQHVFVNRRPVENRGLNFALIEGYHTALMKGRYPVCCLFLEIDPALVDVNIHPAKREVKFHNERAVRHLVAQAVRETLLAFHGGAPSPAGTASATARTAAESPSEPIPPHSPDASELPGFTPLTGTPLAGSSAQAGPPATPAFPLAPARDAAMGSGPRATTSTTSSPSSTLSTPTPSSMGPGHELATRDRAGGSEVRSEIRGVAAEPEPAPSTGARGAAAGLDAQSPPHPQTVPPHPAGAFSATAPPLLNIPLRLVGVIGRLYVVLESDRGMVLMDQHAAHERILFEQMLERVESGTVPSQRLLLPETVELSPRDAAFLREQMGTLNRLGVGLSEFGDRTFLLDAVPPMVRLTEARRFVVGLVDALKATGQTINSQRLGEDTIAKTVCRHAVKANDPLSGPELANLVEDLRRCAMPYTCPHGRPTLIEMSYRELEKKFGRMA